MFMLSPLPSRFGIPTTFSDCVCIDGLTLHRAGLSATGADGEQFVGAAVSGVATGLFRAEYELWERAATLDALNSTEPTFPLLDASGLVVGTIEAAQVFPQSDCPTLWAYARSNGIALHQTWRQACQRARQELAERDRVLRSWFEQRGPRTLDWAPPHSLQKIKGYRWGAYAFDATHPWSSDIAVVGVVGMPSSDVHPMALGFAGRTSCAEATKSALTEALQQLAFLWDEETPSSPPDPSPTALFHLEHFQFSAHRPLVSRWLSTADSAECAFGPEEAASTLYVDLTPPWLTNGMRVAKAICSDAWPLRFGQPPAKNVSPELLIHPVA